MVYFLLVWFNYQLYQLVEGHILPYLSDCYYVFCLDTLFADGTVWDNVESADWCFRVSF